MRMGGVLVGNAMNRGGAYRCRSVRHRRCPEDLWATARWRLVAASAIVAALLLTIGLRSSGFGVVQSGATSSSGAAPVDLFVSDGFPGQRLRRIEPRTLAETGDAVRFAKPSLGWALSDDGSTLARIEYHAGGTDGDEVFTVVVHDGLGGPERIRFRTPSRVVTPRLSADGSVLVVLAPGGEQGDVPAWLVFDSATGRLRTTIAAEGRCCWNYERAGGESPLIDPEARRLYQLVVSSVPGNPPGRPAPVRVVAVDLTTGAEVGRLVLPDEVAGLWQDDRPEIDGDRYFRPGVALSPDGRHLAIVHPEVAAVTLIDTARLTVERTVAIGRPKGTLDRLLGLLPLPQEAEAKSPEGTSLAAAFGPDARFLYVFGYEDTGFDAGNRPTFAGLGVRVVDLDRNELAAEALAQDQIDVVLPAPDGRGVYVFGPEEPDGPGSGGGPVNHVLRRLNAATLDSLAERDLFGERQILLRPGSNGGQ